MSLAQAKHEVDKMNFIELLYAYKNEAKKCFINGMPEEDGGVIIDIAEDYLVFQIEHKSEKLEGTTVEKVIIPLSKIDIIGLVPQKKVIETPAIK